MGNGECGMQDADETIKCAAARIAIAVVEQNDCFLIGRRPAGVALAGFWEFPGGKVLDDEEPSACAARECREETGMEVDVGELLCECEYEYAHGRLRLQFYHCRPLNEAQPPRSPFLWVARQELKRYNFPPANAELLKLLVAQIDL